jgi:hypothetical protein
MKTRFYLLQRLFTTLRNKGNDNAKPISYHDELYRLLDNEDGIIHSENMEVYINSKFDENISFVGAVSVYGFKYQREFSSLLHTLLYNYEDAAEILNIRKESPKNFICKLEVYIEKSYKAYKDYLINLVQFFFNNPGFYYPLSCYPQTMLSTPFYDYLKDDNNLTNYNDDTRELLYLKLIREIIFARFLELNETNLKAVRKNLVKYTKSNNENIAAIAEETKNKLYRYKSVKCPDYIIFISLLTEKELQILAEYTINRFFEKGTTLDALKLAFKGHLLIIPEDNNTPTGFYKKNPNYFEPLIIKYKKRGYISLIFNHLKSKGYISNDYLWESIARHKYFKSRKQNGDIEFVTANGLSQALSDKNTNSSKYRRKTIDKEFEELETFLSKNFKQRSTK